MSLDDDNTTAATTTQLNVNLVGNSIDDLVGKVVFNNSRYNDRLDSIVVESVLISSTFKGENLPQSMAAGNDQL